jgi:hypothetical protein
MIDEAGKGDSRPEHDLRTNKNGDPKAAVSVESDLQLSRFSTCYTDKADQA